MVNDNCSNNLSVRLNTCIAIRKKTKNLLNPILFYLPNSNLARLH